MRHSDPALENHMMVRTLGLGLPAGTRLGAHDHPWAQLIFAPAGMVGVTTPKDAWVVPSQRAVWIDPATPHAVETTSTASVKLLYLRPDVAPTRTDGAAVLHVSALLRALMLEITRLGHLDDRHAADVHLAAVLRHQIVDAAAIPSDLPLPLDPRARAVADRVRADPGAQTRLAALAAECGAAPRTIERIFVRQTAMPFGRWRQHARLLHAIRLLSAGERVTDVAVQCGYDSTSAFIAMFKRATGSTPRRYLAQIAETASRS